MLIGSTSGDSGALFVRDLQGITAEFYKGNHSITAKAYDRRGAVGTTLSPYLIEITGGPEAPILHVSNPSNSATLVVEKGNPIIISYTASDGDGNLKEVTSVDYPTLAFPLTNSISGPVSNGTINYPTTGAAWTPGRYQFLLRAVDTTSVKSYTKYVNVLLLPAGTLGFASTLTGNLAGGGIGMDQNPLFLGVIASSSTFSGGIASGLNMNTGTLLTTGRASWWNRGNIDEKTSQPWNSPGDADLLLRVGGFESKDAATLEFDVNCINGQLEVAYQFGSEEYDRYIASRPDGFMIQLDVVPISLIPEIQPAKLPKGTAIINANTINRGFTPTFVFEEEIPASNPHLFLPSALNSPNKVEYNGVTVLLRSHAFVTPGVHRMRVVISDINDAILDSAVFLEAGSLRTIVPTP